MNHIVATISPAENIEMPISVR
jgi:hypothetical protein